LRTYAISSVRSKSPKLDKVQVYLKYLQALLRDRLTALLARFLGSNRLFGVSEERVRLFCLHLMGKIPSNLFFMYAYAQQRGSNKYE